MGVARACRISSVGGGVHKTDESLKSFLFTLKNPHNVPARRFALKAEKEDEAICCDSEAGPNFCDIDISDNCNAFYAPKDDDLIYVGIGLFGNFGRSSTCHFGSSYTNDTGLDGTTFFTGSENFQVEKIEVFGITE
jgi:hypothetical protein